MENRQENINKTGSNSKIEAQPLSTVIDAAGFWVEVFKLKLNSWGLDQSPVPITGYFTPCKSPHNSEILRIDFESLPAETGKPFLSTYSSQGNRNKCLVPGTLYNFNTIEGFFDLDRQRLLNEEVEKVWADIQNGKVEEDCSVLLRFLVISFADLKKWTVCNAIAFPTLVLDPPPSLVYLKPASAFLSEKEAESLSASCKEWRSSTTTTGVPFFIVTIDSDSHAKLRHLNEWESCLQKIQKILFGFYDPCHLRNKPGWPLLNFLAFVHSRWNLATVHFFCYRENRGFPDMGLSLIGEAQISAQEWKVHNHIPGALGWQLDSKKQKTTSIDLSSYMDVNRRADAAADMNLKLMTWRALPSLDICLLSTTKCLLVGAGTLGCQVARLLMAWGVRKITLLDNGKVAISNPLRQSLYTLNDVGEDKATAAANSLKSIFPPVDAEGIVMSIPMPGHPVSGPEEGKMLDDCRQLQELVNSHDVVFLLTDTRESRWLPTLLSASANKITINAALGFESFLVMRHGAGYVGFSSEASDALSTRIDNLSTRDESTGPRLGCYFCNDVVAPVDSTSNRTLDQQCTVTRPGLAPIASALAVELLITLLHHPLRDRAPADSAGSSGNGSESPLGTLPHQIRGSLSEYSQMTLVGHASNSCTACSKIVLSEFQNNGTEFILRAINHPTYLEDITGLTELKQAANSFESDWDIEEEVDNDGCA